MRRDIRLQGPTNRTMAGLSVPTRFHRCVIHFQHDYLCSWIGGDISPQTNNVCRGKMQVIMVHGVEINFHQLLRNSDAVWTKFDLFFSESSFRISQVRKRAERRGIYSLQRVLRRLKRCRRVGMACLTCNRASKYFSSRGVL